MNNYMSGELLKAGKLAGDVAGLRVGVYSRVSTPHQARGDTVSLMLQLTDLYELAQKRGWNVVGVWSEVGSAAHGWGSLPVLNEVVCRQLKYVQADVLAAWDVSRLSRHGPLDFLELYAGVQKAGGVGGIVTLDVPAAAEHAEQRVLRREWEQSLHSLLYRNRDMPDELFRDTIVRRLDALGPHMDGLIDPKTGNMIPPSQEVVQMMAELAA
ncbi:MAG: recombinase family protein [Ktedonobacterales bacterium]